MRTFLKIYLIVFLVIQQANAASVSLLDTPENTAKQFITAAFIEKMPAKEVAEKFMYFRPLENFSFEKRIDILKKHIKKLKKEKPALSDSTQFSFVRYIDYKQEKVHFKPEAENNIVILLSNNRPILYLYLENDKIVSFDYFIKADLAFFITY